MSIEIRRFLASDLAAMPSAGTEADLLALAKDEGTELLAEVSMSWTAVFHDGRGRNRPCAAAGFLPVRTGTLAAWSFVDTGLPLMAWREILGRMRAAIRDAHAQGFWRIEAAVRSDFDGGLRLVRHLGFEPEGIARAWTPDRRDAIVFAHVAGDPFWRARPRTEAVR